jgi:hypothetical protein
MKSKVNSSLMANVDEIQEETSYDKGLRFEKEFANYMKKNLGYNNAVIRNNTRSATNASATNVDVIGFKTDPRGKDFRMAGIICMIIAFLGIVFKAIYTFGNENNTLDSASNAVLNGFILFFFCAGFVTLKKSKSFEIENGWVECKNRKTKSTHDEVEKMYRDCDNYKKINDKKYKFTELYFVSANGFVADALEFAKNNNVRCFVLDANGDFEELLIA